MMRKFIASVSCACLFSALVGQTAATPVIRLSVVPAAVLSGAFVAQNSRQIHPAIAAATTPLAITSGTPPSGKVGVSYGGFHYIGGHAIHGFILSATGGQPPYKWSATGLPRGLTPRFIFYGGSVRCCVAVEVIAGTPTTAGTYHAVLTVSDSANPKHHKSASYTIKILPR